MEKIGEKNKVEEFQLADPASLGSLAGNYVNVFYTFVIISSK